MSDEYYLEGATIAQGVSASGIYEFFFSASGNPFAPEKKTGALSWTRLRDKPFASRDDAWTWLHGQGERCIRERIVAVRLVQVVERRIPTLLTMFAEATPDDVQRLAPPPAKAKKGALGPYDVPGDEWKNIPTEDTDDDDND